MFDLEIMLHSWTQVLQQDFLFPLNSILLQHSNNFLLLLYLYELDRWQHEQQNILDRILKIPQKLNIKREYSSITSTRRLGSCGTHNLNFSNPDCSEPKINNRMRNRNGHFKVFVQINGWKMNLLYVEGISWNKSLRGSYSHVIYYSTTPT